jgi:membrane protein DedA with SNARE-associated domain
VDALITWLTDLPPTALLGAMTLLAALENIFPPIPADVLIALGAFIAARNDASPIPAFVAVLGGNVAGAMAMYAMGRRFGASWTERKFHLRHKDTADSRLSSWYARYGVASIFLARFIPGVRAMAAPFAGALKAPVLLTAAAILLASGVWYGIVTIIAFRAGNNWEQLAKTIGHLARNTGLVALAVGLLVAGIWYWRRRRRK